MASIAFSIIMSLIAAGCADRQLPDPPESSLSSEGSGTGTKTSTSTTTDTSQSTKDDSTVYFGWGANVGSAATKKALADCNINKKYFDRAADSGKGQCIPTIEVPAKCTTLDEVRAVTAMDEAQLTFVQNELNGQLKGYLFDQCVNDAARFLVYTVLPRADGSLVVTSLIINKK
jgi:hypothetical protein